MAAKKKQRKERKRPTDKLDCLYRAVDEWVRTKGGTVVVAGPVSIMRWPGDAKLKYSVVIQCLGMQPVPTRAE